jgi:hypothetical protein
MRDVGNRSNPTRHAGEKPDDHQRHILAIDEET